MDPNRTVDTYRLIAFRGLIKTTIINTAHLHRRGMLNCIGRPTPNNSVYVLDEHLRPVPVGHPGTLWAGGAGVSRGYVNRPELTASKYKRDPFVRDGCVPCLCFRVFHHSPSILTILMLDSHTEA